MIEHSCQEGIDVFRIDSGEAGPRLMFSGGVHGNEKAGPNALQKLIEHIKSGDITINSGVLTIVPVCNPKAFQQNARFVEYNLNRSMYPRAENEIKHYEDNLRNVLCPLLEQTDYLLDLHSCTAKSEPFVILGGDAKDPDNVSFAKSLGVPRILWGWSDAVTQSDDMPDPRHNFGMTEYAREFGARAATIECGDHEHLQGAEIAFQAICNALGHLSLTHVDANLQYPDVFKGDQVAIRFKDVFFKTREGQLSDGWVNMQPVNRGDEISKFNCGEVLLMPYDGYLIMPNKNATIDAEWFYCGVEEKL